VLDAVGLCVLFNVMNWVLEGTGIPEYQVEPNNVDEETLKALRGVKCYCYLSRANGRSDSK